MKNVILIVGVVAIPVSVLACSPGCYLNEQKVCICDILPQSASPVKPSDEKPPKEKMPSYQRPGIVALMPDSLVTEDEKADREKAAAEKQGKAGAGLK